MALRHNCDAGNPTANFEDDDKLAGELGELVTNPCQQVAAAEMNVRQPTISVT